MVFIEKVLIFLACTALGLLILMYTEPIVRMFGKMDWAEIRLGAGSTYTVWKLIGIILIIGSLVFVTTVHW
ncbi:MAG: hypothetical protein ABSE91_00365 [Patescibacteria group bacterium]|jgi:hypothetical protein